MPELPSATWNRTDVAVERERQGPNANTLTVATRVLKSGRRGVHPIFLAALTGILSAVSFPKQAWWPLVFVALVPLLSAISHASVRRAFLLGWTAGLAGIFGAFNWVLPAIARFEHTSAPIALPFFALFVASHAIQFAIFAAGVALVKLPGTSGRISVIAFTAAWWVLLEWSFPKIIPWSFGDALAASRVLRQVADIGGTYGLSCLVAIVNACVAEAITTHGRSVASGRLAPLTFEAMLLAVCAHYGHSQLARYFEDAGDGQHDMNVAVVQGGLRSGREDLPQANEEAWKTYLDLTTQNQAAGNPDLVVWPETTLRVYLRQDAAYRARVVELVRRLGSPLLLGSLDLPANRPGELNSAYLIQNDSGAETRIAAPSPMQIYHKQRLLPFGEYVPGKEWLPLLSRWHTTGGFTTDGSAQPTLAFAAAARKIGGDGVEARPITRVAPSICFEALMPGAFNRAVREGAEFLVNITDDGWFGDTAGPYEHLEAATLGAVETRRWLVRASNSGVSAFIDPTGTTVASLPIGTAGVLQHPIGKSRTITLYVRWGNWPILLSFVVVTLMFGQVFLDH